MGNRGWALVHKALEVQHSGVKHVGLRSAREDCGVAAGLFEYVRSAQRLQVDVVVLGPRHLCCTHRSVCCIFKKAARAQTTQLMSHLQSTAVTARIENKQDCGSQKASKPDSSTTKPYNTSPSVHTIAAIA